MATKKGADSKSSCMQKAERGDDNKKKLQGRFLVKQNGRICFKTASCVAAEREAARMATEKMKKTVEWNHVREIMEEFEKLIGIRSPK